MAYINRDASNVNSLNPGVYPVNRTAYNAPHFASRDGKTLQELAPGQPSYSGGFIPEIWSGKLIENFYDITVLAAISNTDHESEIKGYGDTVKINNTPHIAVSKYSKGQQLKTQIPDAPLETLLINEGQYFSCLSEDVDKTQTNMNLMDIWSQEASKSMKIAVDSEVLSNICTLQATRSAFASLAVGGNGTAAKINSGNFAGRISQGFRLGAETPLVGGTRLLQIFNAENDADLKLIDAGTLTPIYKAAANTKASIAITKENIINLIINMGTVLDEANCPREGRFLVIPASLSGLILKSELKDASISGDGVSMQRNGRVGIIDTFTIYQSHNIKRTYRIEGTTTWTEYNLIAGHKMALTFASQMVEMETLRTETTFGAIVRGLQVYGFQILKPEALLESVITIPIESAEFVIGSTAAIRPAA